MKWWAGDDDDRQHGHGVERARARAPGARHADPRRGRRQPQPCRRQRRAARHRQGVRRQPDVAQPGRGRLLARPRRLGPVSRRARRPLRAQDDARDGDGAVDPRLACSRAGALDRGAVRRARGRRPLGRHGLPDDAGADHRAVVGPGDGPGRSRSGRRSAGRSLRSARWSRVRCSSSSSGARSSSSRCRSPAWLCWRRSVTCRRTSTRGPSRSTTSAASCRCFSLRRSCWRSTSLPVPGETALVLGLAALALAAGVVFLIRAAPRRGAALRPAGRGAADLLGRGVRRDHRLRLADGGDVHRPAVPAERARLLHARRGSRDPARSGHDGDRRAALGQARRSARRAFHAADRLRCSAYWAS